MKLTGTGQQMLGGIFADISGMSYPKVYNIEMDPHEDLNVGGINFWPMQEAFKSISRISGVAQEVPKPTCDQLHKFWWRRLTSRIRAELRRNVAYWPLATRANDFDLVACGEEPTLPRTGAECLGSV